MRPMPVEAKCPNAQCGTVLSLQDELAGKQVRCPQCGATIEVPLAGGQATAKTPAPGPEGAAEEAAGQAMPPGHHPARQVCHTCGAVLGVRAVFCPKCGTDVRTGVAVEAKAGGAKKRNPAPLVIAGLGVIVLALVGGGVYLVIRNWDAITGAKEGAAGPPKAEAPVDLGPKMAPRPDRSRRSRAGGERTSRRSSRSSRKASSAPEHVPGEEEKKLAETITDYRARLKDTAAARETASGPDEMAARWTDLYEFCRDNGLHAEAEQCWYRAALLEPRDLDINERLGRTETWRGFAVTAEQARFLQGFRTQVRVVNNEPMLPEVRLQLPGGRTKTLSAGQSVTFTVQPGEITIPFQEGALSGDARGSVKVRVREGEVGTITFLGRYQRELIPSSALQHIHRGMALWRRGGPSKQGGWTKTEQAYVLKTKGKPAVTLGLGEGQRLESIRLKGATLTGASDDGLLFDVREGVVTVVGKLELSSQKGDWVLTGTEKLPVRLELMGRGAQALVRSGLVRHGKRTAVYRAVDATGRLTYTAETQLGPRLRDVVQAASRRLSGEAVKAAQASSRKRLEAQARDAEARGKLTGGWDSELWVARRHKPVQDEQWERWQVEERARALPTGADKAARLGAGEREAVLYLNWQRFRRPLAEVYGAGVADHFEALGEAAVLPLMPEDAVTARVDSVSAASGDGGPEGRKETAWQLRFANSGSALGALERIASSASNPAVRAEALLALGSIGTARALAACRVVTIQSQVRAAKLAALAAAGDEPTLENLAETLKAEPETKKRFLNDLVRIDVPTVLLALDRVLPLYTSQKDRAVMARKLGRTGGNAAMSVLADLIAQAGEPYEEVVSEVPPAERLPLVGSLAGMLRQGGKHARAAALLIAQSRSPAALAALKEAAVKGKLPEAVEGLALLGSAEALEAAAEAKDAAGAEDLDRIFESWRKAPEPGGRFIWQPEVDGKAAVGFLQEVLRSWEGAEVRMRAAELLGRLGEKPDAGALVAVASTPVTARKKKPAATTGTGSRRGPPQGMGPGRSGPPEGIEPGFGGRPGDRGPGAKPKEPKPTGPDMWRPLKESREAVEGTPQMRALELLAENIDPGVLPDLRRLAEKAANIEIKGRALKLLGRVADQKTVGFLRGMAEEREKKFKDPNEMGEVLQARMAAIAGLVAAGDPDAASALKAMLEEAPPPKTAFEKLRRPTDYDNAKKTWSLIIERGVCEAIMSVPERLSLGDVAGGEESARDLLQKVAEVGEASELAVGTRPGAAGITASVVRALGSAGMRLPDDARQLVSLLIDADQEKAPVQVRVAVIDALASTRDDGLRRQLDPVLPGWLKDMEVREHWAQRCERFASRGDPGDWQLMAASARVLPFEAGPGILEHMKNSRGEPTVHYYEAVAGLAELPLQIKEEKAPKSAPKKKGAARRGGKKGARGKKATGGRRATGGKRGTTRKTDKTPPKPTPTPEPGPRQPPPNMPEEYREFWERQQASRGGTGPEDAEETKGEKERRAKQPFEAPKAPDHSWLEEMEFRASCLKELEDGSEPLVAAALKDEARGLLRSARFGPWAALKIWEHGDYRAAAQYLEGRYKKEDKERNQQAVVAVARQIGDVNTCKMLGGLLRAGKGPLPEVARALGALGERGPLFHVLTPRERNGEGGARTEKRGERNAKKDDYFQAVKRAALIGIAYLPDGAQAVEALRYYSARLPTAELRRTAERALLTAYRLRADRLTAGR